MRNKTLKKGFTLIEIIIVVMFSVVILLAGVNLIRLVIVSRTGSATEYDIQSNLRITSDAISNEIRKAGQIVMLPGDSVDKNALESEWDYIGLESSGTSSEKDIVHYKYNSLTGKHKKKILAKSVKSTSYGLSFKKLSSESSNKLVEFTLLGYANNNTTTPKEKLLSEVEARNTREIENENKDASGIIFLDTDDNFVSNIIKFKKTPLPPGGSSSTDFSIVFNANGGSPTPKQQSKKTGDLVDPVTDPIKPGDPFNAWYKVPTGEGTPTLWNFETDTVTESMTLIANYNSSRYHEIKFYTNGGSPTPIPQNIKEGDYVNAVINPLLPGGIFKYWYVKPEAGDFGMPKIWDFSTDKVTKSMTLVSFYDIGSLVVNKYDVEFNANGGFPTPAPQLNIQENTLATKPTNPTKPGYNFIGWTIDEIGLTDLVFWDFATSKVTKNVKLIAQYAKIGVEHKVSFLANGGFPVPAQQTRPEGSLVNPVQAPIKPGYTFYYWYDDSKSSPIPWDFNKDLVLKEMTLSANWIKDTTLDPITTTSPSTTNTPTTTNKPTTTNTPTTNTPTTSPLITNTPKPTPKPKVNVWITLVLDRSGSMYDIMNNSSITKSASLRKSVSELLRICDNNPNIEINIVPFSDSAQGNQIWYNAKDDADLLKNYFDYSAASLSNTSNPLHPRGSTNIGDALRVAYGNLLRRSENKTDRNVKRYFILLSDGESTLTTVKKSTDSYLDTIYNATQLPSSFMWLPVKGSDTTEDDNAGQPVYNDLTLKRYDKNPTLEPLNYTCAVADTIDPDFVKTYLIAIPGYEDKSRIDTIGNRLHAIETVEANNQSSLDAIFKIIARDAIDPE